MKKYKKVKLFAACVAICLFFLNTMNTVAADESIYGKETNVYERYFQFKKFTSENGLEGTSVNCILPSKEGFLWIGGYAGLQQYDGTEFRNYQIDGRTLPVNDIEQDKDGQFWIATNGEGLFRYDSNEFIQIDLGQVGEASYTVNKVYLDSSNKVWIGTKEGLFLYDGNVRAVESLKSRDIISITEVEKNRILVIAKAGNVYLIEKNEPKEIMIPETETTGTPRCCVVGSNGDFLIGTSKEQILKLDIHGKVEKIYENADLKCINSISEIKEGVYWLCADTGIGLLAEDDMIKVDIPLTDSVEEVCQDYEGNYWFVSSRQGMLQVFRNMFSDLGIYLGIKKTVNSVENDQNNLYIGCDDGVYCFHNKELIQNELTRSCQGERTRQIYKDRDNQLWVSTYYSGLRIMEPDGSVSVIHAGNSELETNQIRCTYQRKNGDMLVGTEQGVYLVNKERQVSHLVDNSDFNDMRVLDVREAKNGKIYVSTDGHGVYVVDHGQIESTYTKQQGLSSNIVMKVVPSGQLDGVWLISGTGISFLSGEGVITEIKDAGMSNVLNMDLVENKDAMVYAANGLFRIKEKDLLKGSFDSLIHYRRSDGLPIDFTANAWNCVDGSVLYMCGTEGMACIDMNRKAEEQEMKVYIYEMQMDGKDVKKRKGKYILPSGGTRLTIDVRCINYTYKNYDISYYMEGVNQKEIIVENGSKSEISYTNLKGGDYKYHFKLISPDNGECLAEITIPIQKEKKMLERSEVQILFAILAALLCIMLVVLVIRIKEKRISRRLARKYQEEKDQIIKKMAYRDTVTGVYNRNLFEEDKQEIDMDQVSAVVLFSVSHIRYIEQKLGVLSTGEILRYAVEIADGYQNHHPKIYRLSENVFCGIFFEQVELDGYIMTMKSQFAQKGEKMKLPLSLAVGGIYHNRINHETMDTLINRCEQTRLLDEKKAEAEFVEGQINLLS